MPKRKKKERLQKWWREFPFKKILILGIIVLILDVIFIWSTIYLGRCNGDDALKNLGYKAIELSVQLILLVLFGGLIIQKYNRSREGSNARNGFKRGVLKHLVHVYADVKGVRRILRANCVFSDTKRLCLTRVLYNEHMATINRSQLELEILIDELKITREVFVETKDLLRLIGKMEKYLGKIIAEYETELKKYNDQKPIPLSRLPRLKAMIEKNSPEDHSFADFSERYYLALNIIQRERLKVG